MMHGYTFAKARSKFMLGVCCTFSVLLFCIKVGNKLMKSVLIFGAFLSSNALKLLVFGVVMNYFAFHILFLRTYIVDILYFSFFGDNKHSIY